MPAIRIANFNAEWMNDWFSSGDGPAEFKPTFVRDKHTSDTHTTACRAASLIRAIDADILAIEEAPSRQEEMQLFIGQYLSEQGTALYRFILGDSGGAQKIAVLYKPDSVDSAKLALHQEITGLIDAWECDVDGDAVLNEYNFTRLPLVVNFVIGGRKLQLLALHTKSNFVNNGKAMWQHTETRQNYILAALKNRRRISAEAMRVRGYTDSVLASDEQAQLVVLGDLNDGPGLDYFEEKFLTHNVTDILLGSAFQPEWIFTHAQHNVPAARRYSAVFDDFVTDEKAKKLLLDHILLSPSFSNGGAIRIVPGSGTVHHDEYEAQIVNKGRHREDRPSDHRPVSIQVSY